MYKVSKKPLTMGFLTVLWYNNDMLKETEIRDNLAKLGHDELLAYAVKAEIDRQTLIEQLMTMRNRKYGHSSEKVSPDQLSLFNEANKLLWNVIKSVSTEEQFKKIKLYFKEGLTYQKIGDIYGVSHKAIEKAIKTALAKAKEEISEDDYYFLAKYLLK